MFKSLQLVIYQSMITDKPLGLSPEPPVGICLNNPKGCSSTPYTIELVLDTVEAAVLE